MNEADRIMAMVVDKLKGVDIAKEAELIKQKKSKLSANKRRMVMAVHGSLIEAKEKEDGQSENQEEGDDA